MKIAFGIISILFITVVLLQQKNSSLGSMMGGDAGEEVAKTRRGFEKFLHQLTIVLGGLFVGMSTYIMFF